MTMKFRLPRPGTRYDQKDEEQLRRLIESAFDQVSVGGGGGLESRREVQWTTASLANGASENGNKDFAAPGQLLLLIHSNRAGRLRLYATAAARTNDAARPHTTPPSAGIGIFLDSIWLTAHTKIIAPPVLLFNGDSPAANLIYYTFENLSGTTGTATLTATVVSVEA